MAHAAWLATLRRYLGYSAVSHLAWESLQLPLYTIWADGSWAEIAFAVLHCTAGDLLIGTSALVAALVLIGKPFWPEDERVFRRVLVLAVIVGVAYTIFSEWLNTVARVSWTYSPLMPVVPGLGTGLSPLAQWLLIPPLCLFAARPTPSR